MDKLISTSTPNIIHVAIGIIANANGQLLIAKRPDHWLGGGLWEFPGGKLEPEEDSKRALERELHEEIGILVTRCSLWMQVTHDYPERSVRLYAWHVHAFTGTPTGLEGQEIMWCDPHLLNSIDMLPANRQIVISLLPKEGNKPQSEDAGFVREP